MLNETGEGAVGATALARRAGGMGARGNCGEVSKARLRSEGSSCEGWMGWWRVPMVKRP